MYDILYGMRLSGKNIFTTVLSLICLCFIPSCSFVGDVVHFILTDPFINGWESNHVQYELRAYETTFSHNVTGPVDIYMAKMNVGSQVISKENTRYIESANFTPAGNQLLNSSRSIMQEEEFLMNMEIDDWENVSGITPSGFVREDYAPARDFVPPFHEKDGSAGSARLASVVSEPMKAAPTEDLTVGVTKDLWVDVPASTAGAIESFVNSSKYTKRRATLQAVGTNCYIWVLNDNFTKGTASGDFITREKAIALADKFDSIYEPIREVFGTESNDIISTNWFYTISDTKVNIVVYDIEDDYTEGQGSGVAGYFWAKDYYTATEEPSNKDDVRPLSNEGKYFYVDSGFLNDYPDMIYSTLAHEFQHMINFGQKTMKSMKSATKQSDIVSSSTWSNEMMSMVCEDMIQEYLGIELLDSPVYRLLTFATNYYRSGLTDWLQDSNVDYSYAGAYAFGAYLARNYGGKDLIKQIATNQYVDQDAITQALKAIGKNESFETVFKKYPQALVLDNAPEGAPSFNKSVQGIGGGMMPALNLFTMVAQDDRGNTYSFKPTLLPPNAGNRVDLHPYGFTLNYVGNTPSAGKVNITFSSPVSENEKIYLLVQPKKK